MIVGEKPKFPQCRARVLFSHLSCISLSLRPPARVYLSQQRVQTRSRLRRAFYLPTVVNLEREDFTSNFNGNSSTSLTVSEEDSRASPDLQQT